jgi:hypothetical protein
MSTLAFNSPLFQSNLLRVRDRENLDLYLDLAKHQHEKVFEIRDFCTKITFRKIRDVTPPIELRPLFFFF